MERGTGCEKKRMKEWLAVKSDPQDQNKCVYMRRAIEKRVVTAGERKSLHKGLM